jgi:hypothetical protein
MGSSCCAKPIVRIIKVDDVDAGMKGLDLAIQNVYLMDLDDEEKLKSELVRCVRDFGNYIAPSREAAYKEALLREYNLFVAEVQQQKLRRLADQKAQSENTRSFSKWKQWFKKPERR